MATGGTDGDKRMAVKLKLCAVARSRYPLIGSNLLQKRRGGLSAPSETGNRTKNRKRM
jgi:hypothetical protein